MDIWGRNPCRETAHEVFIEGGHSYTAYDYDIYCFREQSRLISYCLNSVESIRALFIDFTGRIINFGVGKNRAYLICSRCFLRNKETRISRLDSWFAIYRFSNGEKGINVTWCSLVEHPIGISKSLLSFTYNFAIQYRLGCIFLKTLSGC